MSSNFIQLYEKGGLLMKKTYEINRELLSRNIKKIRLSKGLNQQQFGALFFPAADKSIVSRWEKGNSIPNADRLKKISEISGMSVIYLTTGEKTFNDLSDEEKQSIQTQQKDWLNSVNKNTTEMLSSLLTDNFIKNLTIYEKALLSNSSRFIMLKNEHATAILSSIISALIRAKTHEYNDDEIQLLKTDLSEEIMILVDEAMKSMPNSKIPEWK